MKPVTAKDKLIEASLDLMLSKGYGSTTVDELCDAAGVSKGSFYHFFKTKEDLGLELLNWFMEQSKLSFLGGEFRKEKDPLKRAFAFLSQTEASAMDLWQRGCLLGNFAVELADTHPVIRKRVSLIFSGVVQGVAEIFQPISEQYPDRNRLDAHRLAEMYLSIIEGSVVLSRAHSDWAPLKRGLESFRHYLASMID